MVWTIQVFVDSVVVQLTQLYQKLPRNEDGTVKIDKRQYEVLGGPKAALERYLEDGGKYGPPNSPSYLADQDDEDDFRQLRYQLRLENEGVLSVCEVLRKYYPEEIAAIVNSHTMYGTTSTQQDSWHLWKLSREVSEDTAILLARLTSKMPRAKSAPARIMEREARTPRRDQNSFATTEVGTDMIADVRITNSETEFEANDSASPSRNTKRKTQVKLSTIYLPAQRRSERKREPKKLFEGMVLQSTTTASRKKRTGIAADTSYKDTVQEIVDDAAPPVSAKSKKRPAPDCPEASFKPAAEEEPDSPRKSKKRKHAKKTMPKPMSSQIPNDKGIAVIILSARVSTFIRNF